MARAGMALARDGRVPAATLTAVILLGCAREMPPPGARPDEVPPSILMILPAPDSVVIGFDGQLELRFDEPVRLPNGIAREMFASPMEVYEAEMGFSNLRLRPEDGWRDGVMYCYSIPAEGIADLLRNRMEGTAEFCFSTGADIEEGRVRGSLIDGLTGQPQRQARVIFWADPDSVPYGAVTDSAGEFVTRGLPAGDYEAFGFIDRNRNLIPDRELESYDSIRVRASPDSLQELQFEVLPPDTTPPFLARAVMAGGAIVQLEFDDFLLNPQPGEPEIAIRDSAANAELEIVGVLVGSADAVTFAADSVAVDSAAAEGDSAAVADSAAVEPPAADSAAAAADTTEEEPVLPSRFLTVRVAAPLDSATYLVSVSGVVNVRRLVGGGDTSFVAEPPPPPEDSTPAVVDSTDAPAEPAAGDTAGVPPDTAGVPPDTAGVPPDTAGVPPDTAGVPPDTLSVPPDTLGAPPDTAGRKLPPGGDPPRRSRPGARRRT